MSMMRRKTHSKLRYPTGRMILWVSGTTSAFPTVTCSGPPGMRHREAEVSAASLQPLESTGEMVSILHRLGVSIMKALAMTGLEAAQMALVI